MAKQKVIDAIEAGKAALAKPAASNMTAEQLDIAEKVVKRLVGEQASTQKPTSKSANLPLVSAVYKTTTEMNRAIEILDQAHETNDAIKELTAKLQEVKEELSGICLGSGIDGFRYGNRAVLVNTQTRQSLSVKKLLENGVTPEQIAASYTESDPFYVTRLEKVLRG